MNLKSSFMALALLSAMQAQIGYASPLDIFFGLPAGTLSTAYSATNGSGLFRVLDAPAGESLTFSWAYKAGDYAPFSDSAFVSVNGNLTTLASTSFDSVQPGLRTGINVANGQYTGIVTTTVALAPGINNIGFGVVNSRDTLYDPTLILFSASYSLASIPNGDFSNGLQGWEAPALGGTVGSGDIKFPVYGGWDPFSSVGGLEVILGSSTQYAIITPSNGLAAFAPGSPGESAQNPLLPNETSEEAWIFNNVESGLWIDPPFINGFNYSLNNGAFVTSINFPTGAGFESFTNLSISSPQCPGIPLGTFGNTLATTFSFANFGCSNVNKFSIFSSSPIFDFGDQAGFPLQIFFSGASATQITMTPYDPNASGDPVPEPSSLGMMAASLVFFAWRMRK